MPCAYNNFVVSQTCQVTTSLFSMHFKERRVSQNRVSVSIFNRAHWKRHINFHKCKLPTRHFTNFPQAWNGSEFRLMSSIAYECPTSKFSNFKIFLKQSTFANYTKIFWVTMNKCRLWGHNSLGKVFMCMIICSLLSSNAHCPFGLDQGRFTNIHSIKYGPLQRLEFFDNIIRCTMCYG